MPRVLFVTRKWAPAVGGMETWSQRLSEELAQLVRIEVVALPGRADGGPPSAARLLTFPFTVLRRVLAARPAPDVVHLGDMAIWPLGLPALWRGARVVVSAHGTDAGYHRRDHWRGKLYGLYLRLGARLLRRAAVIANSRATARAAAETGWTVAAVVPLATDMAGTAPASSHDGALLFAGRLVEQKGCAWFVREVLPLLPPETRLKVAGTVWHKSEAVVLEHPQVDYLGALATHELAQAYARALAVIVPNIELANGEFEGFGLVPPEAAAAGGVVLAADHGGLRDAVIDGETGILLPAGDAAAWAEAVMRIAGWSERQRADFVARAQARTREQFSWDRVARETAALYRSA